MKLFKTYVSLVLVLCALTEISFAQDSRDSIPENKKEEVKYPRTYGGITFSRIDWGLSRVLDEGKFTLSDDNEFLEYSRASNFGFDVLQYGVRFNDKFKIYISTGVEWNYLRLKKNILLTRSESPLSYQEIDPSEVEYTKNVLTSTYLRVPLTVEFRTRKFENGKRMKFALAGISGFRLKGTQRLKSEVHGQQKFKDNYNLAKFQYGAVARVGYDQLGIFGKYYFNSFFDNSPNQDKLNNFAFGLTLGF